MDIDGLAQHIDQIGTLLLAGKFVVLRTDTLYGITACADDEAAVRHLQTVREREPGKAFIVLIADADMAYGDDRQKIRDVYDRIALTGPTSIVVENSSAPEYLRHRDGSLAYRIPQHRALEQLLRKTGPIVAPSANLAGQTPSRSVGEARAYFGDAVSAYVDDGETPVDQQPSAVIQVARDGSVTKLR